MIRALVILCAVLAVTGCRAGVRDCPSTPVPLDIDKPVREPIPSELTLDMDASACVIEGPTVGDVRKQRQAACAAIKAGNGRFQQLRALRPE